ncbi:XVIPCD domain-containing protein [Stenotrophomonas sp. 9(2022)]|uniref:XVIPCD domain-containing protein n=1 Tax=Stenotrophomonas sp. 9(2022) TaxID=2950153 RepID=UPI002114F34B|nr:XVIPCD domain-containing protein [Stenotrophomonas sp. 9(2022)]
MTPDHPQYSLHQQIRQGVADLDEKHGRAFDTTSENMTASLTVKAREQGLERADHVVVSNATAQHPAGHNIFVVQGDPANPAHLRAMLPTAEAAQTPAEQSLQKLGIAPQQPAMGLQPEQQAREQEQQQNPAHRLG